ncbi:penicillin-binding transpeptidase domain-containing protein [Pseudactinotalea terrae]|uniref:penicillin-binding transpeptidase domain-containing protein n=1 Tax=Pseudactinotalea terrae TaxID=1743262 RepID=UPI0012E14BBB|nr:penicillin-binding transpeptidase domain-containing protein [Pseudactinotalea terrae]
MTRRRLAGLASMVLAAGIGLTACSASDPEPGPVAEAFAADLTDGTFDGAPVADPALAAEQLTTLLGDLAEFPREVTAGEITEVADADGGTDTLRDVALTWTFEMGEDTEPLVLSSAARLELVPSGESEAWTAVWHPGVLHPDADEESTIAISRVIGERGDVTGFGGEVLVEERPVMRIGIDKQNLAAADYEAAAQALGEALALDDVQGYVDRVAGAGEKAFVVAITIRSSEADTYSVDELRVMQGVLIVDDLMLLAPTPTFARPILGSVGEATAEIIEGSEGQIEAGDVVGLSGLQRLYDAQLRGTPGMEVTLTGAAGEVELSSSDPVDGADLETTLHTTLQAYAEDRLAGVTSPSAIVAIQASTGAVLAAASGPAGEGFSTATVGQYPAGSTFKIATALALLRAGLTPDSEVECTPTLTVEGYEFENYPGYPAGSVGTIPLSEAIAQSCNTALIAQHEQVSAADLHAAAASLGIGAAMPEGVSWPFPYFSGTVPADATGTTHAADFIGQGGVLVSPLAMAGLAASVAAGQTVTPVLVTTEDAAPPEPAAAPLTSAEATQLQQLMYGVVSSGSSTFLQDVPGDPVGAKSGTAQYGTDDPPATHAWMIAFQGDLAVAVFVEVGDYGTATAGPIIEDFLTLAAETDWAEAG